MPKNVHVVPNERTAGWSVKKDGASRASVNTSTKAEAIRMGRVISQRSRSRMVIHNRDGSITK